MSPGVFVSPEILEAWPGYMPVVVIAEGVRNGPSDEASEGILTAAERAAAASGLARASEDRRIAAWRAAFSQFGAKPSRYPCSAEALLARVLKGERLPRINALVDTYNAVSLRHVIPVGGEDLDTLQGDLRLVRATGDELFEGRDDSSEGPRPGEVVWRDDLAVTSGGGTGGRVAAHSSARRPRACSSSSTGCRRFHRRRSRRRLPSSSVTCETAHRTCGCVSSALPRRHP